MSVDSVERVGGPAKRIKVLLLLHPFGMGGAPKVALDLFSDLANSVDVKILAFAQGGAGLPDGAGAGILAIRPRYAGGSRLRKLQSSLRVRADAQRVRAWQPDLIFANSVASLSLVQQLELPPVPTLLYVHELDAVIRSLIGGREAVFADWPTRYLACSEAVRSALTERFAVPAHKVTLLYSSIPANFAPAVPEVRAKSGDTVFHVGGAGTPELRKGIDLWLLMARELRRLAGAQNVRFTWVGLRDNLDSYLLRDMARKMGLADAVDFVPLTPRPADSYAAFDAFALTSWEDPFPLVVLENMLLGKPVVCFEGSGGATEAIADTGVAVPDFSPAAMAAALYGLMQSPAHCRALGDAAAERVRREFTTAVQAPRLYAEFCRMLGRDAC